MPRGHHSIKICKDCGGPCSEAAITCMTCVRSKSGDGIRRICTTCLEVKPLDQFWKKSDGPRGRNARCIQCGRARARKKYRENPDKSKVFQRRGHLHHNYGISVADYNKLLEAQDGKCKICGKNPNPSSNNINHRSLHVDHCHDTQVIRGLLCHNCNHGLGAFKDDILIMEQAIQYLADYKLKYAQSLL